MSVERKNIFVDNINNEFVLPFGLDDAWKVGNVNLFEAVFYKETPDSKIHEIMCFLNTTRPSINEAVRMSSGFTYKVGIDKSLAIFDYGITFGHDDQGKEKDGFQLPSRSGISIQLGSDGVRFSSKGNITTVAFTDSLSVSLPHVFSPKAAELLFNEPQALLRPERVEEIIVNNPLEITHAIW